MVDVLITEYGGANSNAYIDLADATDYLASYKLDDSIWTSASTDVKNKAILVSTKMIDSIIWHGRKRFTANRQALQFPRELDVSQPWPYNLAISAEAQEVDDVQREMEDRVRKACAEQAFALVRDIDTGDEHYDKQKRGVISWSQATGPVSESYSYKRGSFSKLAPEARDYLRSYIGSPRVVRGGAFDSYVR